jgi:cell division inhibitor SepF
MGLFSVGKKKKKDSSVIENKTVKSDQIIFEKLLSDEDKYLTGLTDKMLAGSPLILSFETLDIDQANKVIAFLSGVIYATQGEIINVKDKVFMFATKDVYEDGSMDEFLKEIVE